MYSTPPPVDPPPELLPLDDPNPPWERFEAFCENLISRLPGVKETHRYGRRGSRQRGIDIFADLENGERWAFQCRQWEKFTKYDATRAIGKTTYKADRFILTLSRQATSGVRDACDSQPDWDVWDVGDISRKVREMSMDSAAKLVEAHFGPSWRQAFLGLKGLTPFLTTAEFFQPFSNASVLFNHAWQLVGRSDHLRQIHDFVESPEQTVAILVGRGGIGKSKILHALAETFDSEHGGVSLWFTAEGVPLTQDGADHLPYEPCVLVVDDAHRRDDLPALLALSRQRLHVTKLILSCRPQAGDHVRAQLTHGGFEVHETASLPDVKEMSREEVTELGRQALGVEFAHLAEQLTAATWDCPLVTVVGGRLLAEKAIAPDLLERDEEFRHTVLARFQDVLVGAVGDRIEAKLCRSLLELISTVQPIRLDNEKALDAEAEFLGIDRPELLRSLGVLEEAGVLLRRGNTLRIVPDVLADHILHQVSITPQGQSTRYADSVFEKFASICPSEVLRNLAELDWRLRSSGAQASDLLSGIWQSIEQEFQEASNQGRCAILGILEQVAVYQPGNTLALVEYAIRNPATKPEDSELSRIYEFTNNDVLHQVPKLLRRISYTLDFLPRCCNLLWELGRDDDRALNSHPDHAMRVLTDLASYDIEKPSVVHHRILDVVEKLLEDPGSHEHVHSPLDIITPMLAKAGHSTRSEGHKLVFRPFVLKKENVKAIRQRSIALSVDCLSSNSLKVLSRALQSLGNALQEPIREFEVEISDEDREQWRSEQLEILGHIADLAQRSSEPEVRLRIREILSWHRSYSAADAVRNKAEAIIASMAESFEVRLTEELADPFHSGDRLPEEREGDDGYRRHRERIEQTQRALVAELLSQSGSPSAAHRILTGRIQALTDASIQATPQVVLGILGDSDPKFAAGLCDIIVDDPNGALAPYLQPLLSNVRMWNAERARGIGQRALAGNSNILCRGVALSYQYHGWAGNATKEDIEIIRELLGHADMYARRFAIGSLGALAEAHQRVSIDLAKEVELGDSTALAAELCELFVAARVPFRSLTTEDIKNLLSKLEETQDIGDFNINAFLVKASEQDAKAVAGLLLTRVKKNGTAESWYSPLPSPGFRDRLIGLTKSPDLEAILRAIRDASLESGWLVDYWMPQLFREVSSDFQSAASLSVLDEWITLGSASRIESAAHLVSAAQPDFVFEHIDFVSHLLERAQAAGDECYKSVTSSLASSTLTGVRSGTPGEPMPQDVATRDQASALASQFDAGSPACRFYTELAASAEASINYQLLMDEELSG